MHFDRNPFTCSCEKEKKLTDFKFGTFVSRFLSDGAASMAAKGLIVKNKVTQIVSINNTVLAGTVVSRSGRAVRR